MSLGKKYHSARLYGKRLNWWQRWLATRWLRSKKVVGFEIVRDKDGHPRYATLTEHPADPNCKIDWSYANAQIAGLRNLPRSGTPLSGSVQVYGDAYAHGLELLEHIKAKGFEWELTPMEYIYWLEQKNEAADA